MLTAFFPDGDLSIHRTAVDLLLGMDEETHELTLGEFGYLAKGGKGGSLSYRRGRDGRWVLIANWFFYDAFIAVRYRKALWLRPLYDYLFARMNYRILAFDTYSIRLLGSEGELLKGRLFRLSPPGTLRTVLADRFSFQPEQISQLEADIGMEI